MITSAVALTACNKDEVAVVEKTHEATSENTKAATSDTVKATTESAENEAAILSDLTLTSGSVQNQYVVPPSTAVGNAPVISDAEMEKCVILYNESEWIVEDLKDQVVDQYSEESVNSYNIKVQQHSDKLNYFNKNCAGKQSQSAYEAAQKLNQQ